jgi:hypothetical protein
MKAFLASVVAAIVIAFGAYYALGSLKSDSGSVYSSDNVRLGS